ncbi:MAG: beta-N-acetylglucosaminidase domain-containing protein [Bacteroidales bacterium]|nr:beta-N-acetylglucosaminidase domain-containing protein [Bacteroidales bacterium]
MKAKRILMAAILAATSMTALLAGNTYTIYPVPQSQKALPGTTSFTDKVTIVADPGIDRTTIDRAAQILENKGLTVAAATKADAKTSNIYLAVNGSKGAADRKAGAMKANRKATAVPGKFDRHVFILKGNKVGAEVLILGENTDATFCGLATLEQILDNGTCNLPCVEIEDYADIQYRGVIEGYYGVPYNADVTKDLFSFMARYKMNSYMYGAKSDPYHSHKWAEAYPDSITADQQKIGMLSSGMLREIVEASHRNKVNFIWAIHPGAAFTDPNADDVVDRIMSKFQKMYDLGVRQFGVFVDDIGVPVDQPTLELNAQRLSEVQNAVEERWNKVYDSPADTVKPVNFVPQLYAYSWVSAETRQLFYNSLGKTHPQCVIYITGANVWSVPNSHDLEVVSKELGRGLAWWWNYPCNDNDMTKLFVRDTYANFADEKWIDNDAKLPARLEGASALISNPMQQGAASKIALFGVGDYGWNNAAFDNESDYKAALKAVVGREKADDFEYLSQFLRYYDNEPIASLTEAYKKDGKSAPVKEEMVKLLRACASIEGMAESGCASDSIFVADIQPWLNRVSDMAFLTIQLLDQIDAKAAGSQSLRDEVTAAKLRKTVRGMDGSNSYHFGVLNGMGDDIDISIRSAESSAKVLRPFIDFLAGLL